MTAAPAIAKSSLHRKASARWWLERSASSVTTGTMSSPTWAAEEIAISVASRIFPLCAITIAPPCSAALPTIATMTTAMKNSLRPTASANAPSEWTRISLTQAVAPVVTARTASAVPSDHVPSPGSSCSRALAVAAQVAAYDGEIEQQEHDRHRHRGDDHGVPLRRAGVAKRGRDHERHD